MPICTEKVEPSQELGRAVGTQTDVRVCKRRLRQNSMPVASHAKETSAARSATCSEAISLEGKEP